MTGKRSSSARCEVSRARPKPDFEVVVVDDASARDTRSAVASLGDERLRCVRLDANVGPAAARNRGVREAIAALVAFQDSDDEWFPEKLAKQLAVLDAGGEELGVVTSDMLRVHASGETTYHRSPDIEPGRLLDPETGFYQAFALGTQCALVRRETFDAVGGFDERLRCFEDLDLFLRLAARTRFHRLAEPLVRYHETGGLTTDVRAEIAARACLWRKHAPTLWRESPGFLLREGLLLLARRAGGRRTAGWRGRPFGPKPMPPRSRST